MNIVTLSNLYPRPDQPTRGMFNFQLFRGMAKAIGIQNPESGIQNICLVPEWRIWRWQGIRKWRMGDGEDRRQNSESRIQHGEEGISTVYLPVFYLPLIGRSLNWWFYSCSLRRLFIHHSTFINQKSKISLLASWLYPDAVATARLARDLGIPVWLRVHGTDRYHLKNRWRRRLILDAVAYAQGVICNCQAVSDDLVGSGVPADKIHIIPNGVDTGLFHYRTRDCEEDSESPSFGGRGLPSREAPGGAIPMSHGSASLALQKKGSRDILDELWKVNKLTDKSSVVLFIGNLVPIKGSDVMIKAFALLNKMQTFDGHSTTLFLIGSGPMRRRLERQARELGVADRVHFLGSQPHEEVAHWMNVADVLCLASRSEGMPNVVLEALASGLPVVATAVGACPELLSGEPAARVCPSEDSEALAAAMQSVLKQKTDHEALAARHAARFSWRRQAEAILGLMGESGKIWTSS